jgi:hypothetical protein
MEYTAKLAREQFFGFARIAAGTKVMMVGLRNRYRSSRDQEVS